MEILKSKIDGCYIITQNQHGDNRGFFQELFNKNLYDYLKFSPLQVNHSFNKINVFRGIHAAPFRKLVTCVSGEIVDICVDLRKDSLTYLESFSIILNDSSKQLLIPKDCGHAFLSLKDNTSVVYMQDSYYDPKVEKSYFYKDPSIKLDLNVDESKLILSEKDSICNYIKP